jgi:phosphohistidine phosphatase
MNRLHLLRHAKSGAKEGMDDRDRPLSRRGRETARGLGEQLPPKLGRIDLVLCSSSRRTRETLELVLPEFSPQPRIAIEDGLYLASRQELAARLRRLDANDRNVLLIGHNPGLHELAVALADKNSPDFEKLAVGKFPTAALASFLVPEWSTLSDMSHEMTAYRTPNRSSAEGSYRRPPTKSDEPVEP